MSALPNANERLTEWLNSIVRMDCIDGMSQLPDQSVDVLIADPPYNLSKGGKWQWDRSVALPGMGGAWLKMDETWDDMPLEDYCRFTTAWLTQAKRLVKPTGSLWVHGTYHNIGIVNVVMQMLGIEIINEVVWYKRNAFPNLANRRLTASHETILWAHTGGNNRRYLYNHEAAKTATFPEDSLKQPGKQLRTVWDIPNNKDRGELTHGTHPAQKPLRLLRRMLLISGCPGQLCLAPFAGVGSECIAASQAGLHFIGFETDEAYLDIARARLAAAKTDATATLSFD